MNNLTKFFEGLYGSKIHVLDNINFSIKENSDAGNINSIFAPFEAGKSTLLKIISGVISYNIGRNDS